MTSESSVVLFACVHNAGRSQMAAAWFNALANPARARAISAGTQPAAAPHAEAIAVMREVGIDISMARPRFLSPELAAQAHVLVTMGCGEEGPVVPGITRLDWALADPKGQTLDSVRGIRDQVRALVHDLLTANDWGT
jgi:arsenate reductase